MKRHAHTRFTIPGSRHRFAILCFFLCFLIVVRSSLSHDARGFFGPSSAPDPLEPSSLLPELSVEPPIPLLDPVGSANATSTPAVVANATHDTPRLGSCEAEYANVSVSRPSSDCHVCPQVRSKGHGATVSPDIWKTFRHGACSSIRVRKEISDLTRDELSRFISAVKKLHSGPGPTAYDEFTSVHLNATYFAHGSDTFFPWHREFLWRFEESLRAIDPTVVLPYWDWSLIQHPEQSIIFTPGYFGGNGDAKQNHCVVDGQFAGWSVHYPSPHCLRRQFEGGTVLAPYYCRELIASILYKSEDFTCFRQQLGVPHGLVHVSMSGPSLLGDMGQMYSPNDPVFWLHHAFLDKLYWEYQNRGEKYKTNFGAPDLDLCPFGVPAKSVYCARSLCYTYQEPSCVSMIREYINNCTARHNVTLRNTTFAPTGASALSNASFSSRAASVSSANIATTVAPAPFASSASSTSPASTQAPTANAPNASRAFAPGMYLGAAGNASGRNSAVAMFRDADESYTFLNSCAVDLTNGFVENIDLAPIFRSTFSLDIQWDEPLDTLAMKTEAIARSEDVSHIMTPSSFNRNNTLFLKHPVGLPLAWIRSNSMHEARVRLSEQIVHSAISILNVETTRGKFLSFSNTMLHKQMVHRNSDFARFMPEVMDEEIFVTVNRTRVVVADRPAVVIVQERRQTNRSISIPVYAPDPLANWTCFNFSALPREQIKHILNSTNITFALMSMTSSLIHRPAATPTLAASARSSAAALSPTLHPKSPAPTRRPKRRLPAPPRPFRSRLQSQSPSPSSPQPWLQLPSPASYGAPLLPPPPLIYGDGGFPPPPVYRY